MAEETATPSDRAVLGFCELPGLVFALPFGEDLYRDTQITGTHILYLVIGLVSAATGCMWPRIRNALPLRFSETVARVVLDFRWWLTILLIGFVFVAAPQAYPLVDST